MGKRRQKPLFADQGILHLKSCFVQPSEESGLLSTVGGQDQPLVLASGNYGYGIPHSVAQKAAENAQNKADEEVDPDVLMVREIVRKLINCDHVKISNVFALVTYLEWRSLLCRRTK